MWSVEPSEEQGVTKFFYGRRVRARLESELGVKRSEVRRHNESPTVDQVASTTEQSRVLLSSTVAGVSGISGCLQSSPSRATGLPASIDCGRERARRHQTSFRQSAQALRFVCSVAFAPRVSISFRMSSAFQAVIRGPSLNPLGNRPALIPAHQVDRETGNTDSIAGSRMYPSLGITVFFSFVLICCLPFR